MNGGKKERETAPPAAPVVSCLVIVMSLIFRSHLKHLRCLAVHGPHESTSHPDLQCITAAPEHRAKSPNQHEPPPSLKRAKWRMTTCLSFSSFFPISFSVIVFYPRGGVGGDEVVPGTQRLPLRRLWVSQGGRVGGSDGWVGWLGLGR